MTTNQLVAEFTKLLGPAKIVIQTDADFTPKGKRSARVVKTDRGQQLRWYVGGRIYRRLSVNQQNNSLTQDWLAA